MLLYQLLLGRQVLLHQARSKKPEDTYMLRGHRVLDEIHEASDVCARDSTKGQHQHHLTEGVHRLKSGTAAAVAEQH
jgi:hypothetical protein